MKRKRRIFIITAFIILLCSVEFLIASYYSGKANARIAERKTEAARKEKFIPEVDTEGDTEAEQEEESTETEEQTTKSTKQIKEVETEPILVEVPRVRAAYIGPGYAITCWGDSLTQGTGASGSIVINGVRGATMPSTLANLTNMKVYNMGVYGELSRDIASRQGGFKMYVNNITLPSSGSVYFDEILCEDGNYIDPWTTYDLDVYGLSACFDEVTIAGIKGKLTYDFNRDQFVFTRLDTGSTEYKPEVTTKPSTEANTQASNEPSTQEIKGVETEASTEATTVTSTESTTNSSQSKSGSGSLHITTPTEIITPPSIERVGDILVLQMGNNGGFDFDFNVLVDQYNAMIAHNGNDYFIIVGDTDGSQEDRSEWEYTLLQAFGDHFLNMREYLVNAALNGELDQFGITLNDYDYDQISRGEVPYSLKSDGSHLNSYGYWLEGKAIYELGLILGYWE